MSKYSTDESKIGIIDNYINSNLYAFLINDPGNTIDAASSMTGAAALEITESPDYARKSVILPAATIKITTDPTPQRIAISVAPQQQWSATGTANMPQFTKICYARGATAIRGAASGTLTRVEHANHDSNNNPIAVNLEPGQSYRHTATFEVAGEVT